MKARALVKPGPRRLRTHPRSVLCDPHSAFAGCWSLAEGYIRIEIRPGENLVWTSGHLWTRVRLERISAGAVADRWMCGQALEWDHAAGHMGNGTEEQRCGARRGRRIGAV